MIYNDPRCGCMRRSGDAAAAKKAEAARASFANTYVVYADVWEHKTGSFVFYKALRGGAPEQVGNLAAYGADKRLNVYFSEGTRAAQTGKTLYVVSEGTKWAYVSDFFDGKLRAMTARAWRLLRDSPVSTREQVEQFCQEVLADALGDGVPDDDAVWQKIRDDIKEMQEITRQMERDWHAPPRAPVARRPRPGWQ